MAICMQGVEGDQPDGATAAAGAEGSEFEQRAEYLHEGYRALMDRYRRLKQMAPTPELEKETDNLVRVRHGQSFGCKVKVCFLCVGIFLSERLEKKSMHRVGSVHYS